jgi:predicted dithiol-disulfide oxidoreductase (DUF899 family)
MPDHEIATREDWVTARKALREREREHARLADELARRRDASVRRKDEHEDAGA